MGKKADRLTTDTRTEAVRSLILSGFTVHQIVQNASKAFSVGERQVHNYINHARKSIREANKDTVDVQIAEHIAIRRRMRAKANQANQPGLELAIAQDEARLLGLYPAEKRDITTGGQPIMPPPYLGDKERLIKIDRLLANRKAANKKP